MWTKREPISRPQAVPLPRPPRPPPPKKLTLTYPPNTKLVAGTEVVASARWIAAESEGRFGMGNGQWRLGRRGLLSFSWEEGHRDHHSRWRRLMSVPMVAYRADSKSRKTTAVFTTCSRRTMARRSHKAASRSVRRSRCTRRTGRSAPRSNSESRGSGGERWKARGS